DPAGHGLAQGCRLAGPPRVSTGGATIGSPWDPRGTASSAPVGVTKPFARRRVGALAGAGGRPRPRAPQAHHPPHLPNPPAPSVATSGRHWAPRLRRAGLSDSHLEEGRPSRLRPPPRVVAAPALGSRLGLSYGELGTKSAPVGPIRRCAVPPRAYVESRGGAAATVRPAAARRAERAASGGNWTRSSRARASSGGRIGRSPSRAAPRPRPGAPRFLAPGRSPCEA